MNVKYSKKATEFLLKYVKNIVKIRFDSLFKDRTIKPPNWKEILGD